MNLTLPCSIFLTLTCILGCAATEESVETQGEETSDTGAELDTGTDSVEDTDEEEYEGCQEIELDIKGPSNPAIGDEWFVIMRCDNALMQGPMVIRFTPPDFANLAGKTVLFTTAGEASMRVQVGGYRVDTDIAVQP